jgi:hypothetical protein
LGSKDQAAIKNLAPFFHTEFLLLFGRAFSHSLLSYWAVLQEFLFFREPPVLFKIHSNISHLSALPADTSGSNVMEFLAKNEHYRLDLPLIRKTATRNFVNFRKNHFFLYIFFCNWPMSRLTFDRGERVEKELHTFSSIYTPSWDRKLKLLKMQDYKTMLDLVHRADTQ